MPDTEIVKTVITKQTKQNTAKTQADANAIFVRKMVAKMQQQMFDTTRSNLGI